MRAARQIVGAELVRELAQIKLERPLVIFDLETTGVDVGQDKIIEVAALRVAPGEAPELRSWLVNPVIAIPPAAAAVHGISDEDVAEAPFFGEVWLSGLGEMFVGPADVCGHNVERFDLPLLQRELADADLPALEVGAVVDTLQLYRAWFDASLGSAYMAICGTPLDGAHSAAADVQAVGWVLTGLMARFPIPREPGAIASMPAHPSFIDQRGVFRWQDGVAVISIGKHAGRSLAWMAQNEKGFLGWMLRQDFPDDTKAVARRAMSGVLPEERGAS